MLLILILIVMISLLLLHINNISEHLTNNPRSFNDPIKLAAYKKKHPNSNIQSNTVYSASLKQIKNQSKIKSIYMPKFKENFSVKIDPIITNTKYKLYGEDNLNFSKAGIVKEDTNIDQTTNINIMNYTNKQEGKTIKELYDDITNDNRSDLQKNLDDLEAYDSNDNYSINKQYGTTKFDTYSIHK